MKPSKAEKVVQDQDENDEKNEKSDLRGDYRNVAILLFLYLLQGDD